MGELATPDEREELVGWLTELDEHLRFINSKWAEKARLQSQYVRPLPMKSKWGFGVGMAVFGGAFLLLAIVDHASYSTLVGMLLVAIGIPALVAVGAVRAYNRVRLPRVNARIQAENDKREHYNTEVLGPAEAAVDTELHQAGQALVDAEVSRIYPKDYLYPEAIAYVLTVIKNHRANSVTEALNLYEEALHRQRVENAQQQMIQEQQHVQQLQILGTVANTLMHGATIGAIRDEGAATRASNAANAASIREQLRDGIRIRR